jgi:hypothetical protein
MLARVSLQTFSPPVEMATPSGLSVPDLASAFSASHGPDVESTLPARDQSRAFAYTMFLPDGTPCAFVPRTGESVYQHNQTDLEFL